MLKCLVGSFYRVSVSLIIFIFLVFTSEVYADLDGETIKYEKCTKCHASLFIHKHPNQSIKFWEDTINSMKTYGVNMTDEEVSILAKYLFLTVR